MISDVLNEALEGFERYQTGKYEDYYDDQTKAKIAEIEFLMRRLLKELDTPPDDLLAEKEKDEQEMIDRLVEIGRRQEH